MKDIEKQLDKKISQAIIKYNMIEEGDRILVAVSGGKDSMSLVHLLNKKAQSQFHIPFEIHALHVRTDFDNSLEKPAFTNFLTDRKISFSIVDVPVLARLKPGRKMNCYWCSSQRRMELMKFASEHGYNKIALGHHQDDILETFFMNMSYKGELSTMLPVLKYDHYSQTVIRPLALIKEDDLIRFADQSGLSKITCTCNYDTKSKRKKIRTLINSLAEGDNSIKDNLFKAMSNPVPRYMLHNEEN